MAMSLMIHPDTQTKEFWATSDGVTPYFINMGTGDYVGQGTAEGTPVGITFKCPHNFTSIVSAEVIISHDVNDATADIDIASDYAAEGEAYDTHSESDTATTYNLTANQIYALDVSGILTSMAANDFVGIRITNNKEPICWVIGFRLRYE